VVTAGNTSFSGTVVTARKPSSSGTVLTGSNPGLAPDCHVLGRGTLPGLKYRHLGKSGLKVTNT
jgi:hypothetical protein